MLEGTDVRLRIFAPTLDDPIARTGTATIDATGIEFDNAEFFDLSGDPYDVVGAQLDLSSARLDYTILDSSGQFLNVDNETGFNGYALILAGLRQDKAVSLHSVELIGRLNTLELPEDNVTFNRDTLFINVDGLSFARDEGFALSLGFRVNGTNGRDVLKGDGGDDLLVGRQGADRLVGLAGDDSLLGDAGHDRLAGGSGRDSLSGGAGFDTLLGERGHDLLRGGAGADIFVFKGNFGRDRILDFDPDQRGERIDLGDVAPIRNFRDLAANHLSDVNGDALIETGTGSGIRLVGVGTAELAADDFLF